jgi:hypothetical protein
VISSIKNVKLASSGKHVEAIIIKSSSALLLTGKEVQAEGNDRFLHSASWREGTLATARPVAEIQAVSMFYDSRNSVRVKPWAGQKMLIILVSVHGGGQESRGIEP